MYISSYMTILRLYNLFLTQVFCLIEAVEIVVRRHLNVSNVNVHTLGGGFNYKEVILSEALGSKKVLDLWDIITQNMPLKYENYLLELL